MSKPLQFSMRRMFVAVACFSITALSLYPFVPGAHDNGMSPYVCVPLAFTSAGAGVGVLIGRWIGPFKFQLLADELVNHNPFTAAWPFRLRQRMFNPLDRQSLGEHEFCTGTLGFAGRDLTWQFFRWNWRRITESTYDTRKTQDSAGGAATSGRGDSGKLANRRSAGKQAPP